MFNHGGLYGPDILLDKDIVYVNINYRLGPLGKEDIISSISQKLAHEMSYIHNIALIPN